MTQKNNFVEIGKGAWLDGNLALMHPDQGWMTVADLHYGFECSQRSQGALIPLFGMESVETRLEALIQRHQPKKLILLGDIIHSGVTVREAKALLERLREQGPQIIALAGNHDRRAFRDPCLPEFHRENGFVFFHGDRDWVGSKSDSEIQVTGHLHPAVTIRDGAGTRVKLPALVQSTSRWVMPAFSPWASGTRLETGGEQVRVWACHPSRVFLLPEGYA